MSTFQFDLLSTRELRIASAFFTLLANERQARSVIEHALNDDHDPEDAAEAMHEEVARHEMHVVGPVQTTVEQFQEPSEDDVAGTEDRDETTIKATPAPAPAPAANKAGGRRGRPAKNVASNTPPAADPTPPAPTTAVSQGTIVQTDTAAATAALDGGIILKNSAGEPLATYPDVSVATQALIEVLGSAPSQASLDNIVNVNATFIQEAPDESKMAIVAAFKARTAELKASPKEEPTPAAAPTDPMAALFTEVGTDSKGPAVEVPTDPEALKKGVTDLLQKAGYVVVQEYLTRYKASRFSEIPVTEHARIYTELATQAAA